MTFGSIMPRQINGHGSAEVISVISWACTELKELRQISLYQVLVFIR